MLLKKNIHRKISFFKTIKPPGCRGERRGTGKGKWEAQIYPAIGDKAKASIQVSNLLEVIVPFNSTHREVHVLNSWGVGLRSLPLAKVTWHLHTACTQTRPSTLCLSVPFHNQPTHVWSPLAYLPFIFLSVPLAWGPTCPARLWRSFSIAITEPLIDSSQSSLTIF